jgi:hypothetical protein
MKKLLLFLLLTTGTLVPHLAHTAAANPAQLQSLSTALKKEALAAVSPEIVATLETIDPTFIDGLIQECINEKLITLPAPVECYAQSQPVAVKRQQGMYLFIRHVILTHYNDLMLASDQDRATQLSRQAWHQHQRQPACHYHSSLKDKLWQLDQALPDTTSLLVACSTCASLGVFFLTIAGLTF